MVIFSGRDSGGGCGRNGECSGGDGCGAGIVVGSGGDIGGDSDGVRFSTVNHGSRDVRNRSTTTTPSTVDVL